jgi:hypothetical protein
LDGALAGTQAGATVGESQENDGLEARPEQRLGDAQMKLDDGDLREEVLADVLELDEGRPCNDGFLRRSSMAKAASDVSKKMA